MHAESANTGLHPLLQDVIIRTAFVPIFALITSVRARCKYSYAVGGGGAKTDDLEDKQPIFVLNRFLK